MFSSIPAEFPCRYGLDESVARLRARVNPWYSFSSWGRECAEGTVKPTRVKIARRRPFVRNGFRPYFVGRFVETDGRLLLTGSFSLSLATKLFLVVWFGFCVLWTVAAAVATLMQPNSSYTLPLFGVGMLAFGAALVLIGRSMSRDDVPWLTTVIVQAVGSGSE